MATTSTDELPEKESISDRARPPRPDDSDANALAGGCLGDETELGNRRRSSHGGSGLQELTSMLDAHLSSPSR